MAYDKRGQAPLDPSRDVSQFRLMAGDSNYQEYDPAEVGWGLFQIWSDAEIEAFLAATGGNIPRAIALAYTQMGASWASTGATIRTDDLTYSSKDSVGNWLSLAAYWNKIADDQEQREIDDYFDLVDVAPHRLCHAELSQYPVCNRGCPCDRCYGW